MLSIEPNPYIFNWAEIGQVSEGEINLVSSGEAPVEITQTLLLGEMFSMSEITLPVLLDPGESLAVPIQFTPGTAIGSTEKVGAEVGIKRSDGQNSGRGKSGLPVPGGRG